MQNIEPDQVQLEHNAPQEPAPHTEPLQYAPVASSDHDRRFQKVRLSAARGSSTEGRTVVVDLPDFRRGAGFAIYKTS